MLQTLLIILLTIAQGLQAQLPEIAQRWEQEFIDEKREFYGFREHTDEVFQYDFSEIIGNQVRMKGGSWSTFIGVFGAKNRRIDFHLKAKKQTDRQYEISGKSRLGKNIRKITGTVDLKYALAFKWDNVNVMVFHYHLKEPGDKNGDGEFKGIGTFMYQIKEGKPDIIWSEAGDFREYNNMFVGTWNRFNSKVSRECIFSFRPSGLYGQLPFRSDMYKAFDPQNEGQYFFELKDEMRQYGWEGYKDDNYRKTTWWKNE